MTTKSGKVIGDGGEDTDDPEGRKRRKYSLEASRQSAVGDCCNTSPPEKVRVNQNISCSSSSVSQSSPISPSILQNVESARRTFLEAKPFPHGVVQGLCVDGFLGECGRLPNIN